MSEILLALEEENDHHLGFRLECNCFSKISNPNPNFQIFFVCCFTHHSTQSINIHFLNIWYNDDLLAQKSVYQI